MQGIRDGMYQLNSLQDPPTILPAQRFDKWKSKSFLKHQETISLEALTIYLSMLCKREWVLKHPGLLETDQVTLKLHRLLGIKLYKWEMNILPQLDAVMENNNNFHL